jgi:CubicO group peptidase (beta-lactamase class C family)
MTIRYALIAFFSIFLPVVSLAQAPWPTQGWPTSTPEEQGIDSDKLADAIEFILHENLHAHSLLVIRNGFIVADAYFYPYTPDTRHDLASVTKSITSTLIGIAVDKGLIEDLSQPALGFFAGRTVANLDERKRAMTVEDLLMMESGLQCINTPTSEVTLFQMIGSRDWIQYMLDLPMTDAPGTRFAYNSGGVHLLSAIIRNASGMNALSFARRNLFEPLGISDVLWPLDVTGVDNHGWGDLQLRPHDMAKIGYLFLNNGQWEGRAIVSADWVRAATKRHVALEGGEGYGYLWWMPAQPAGVVEARGRGGQRIIIWPEKNVVIVMTGGGWEPGRVGPFLIAALKSDESLPENPEGAARLARCIERAASPLIIKEGERVPWPKTADDISGKKYVLEPNPLGVQSFTLTFKDRKEAILHLAITPGFSEQPQVDYVLGLDGAARRAPGRNGLPAACSAAWKTPASIEIDIDEVGNISHYLLQLTFEGDGLAGQVEEQTGLGSFPLRGIAR